MSMMAGRVPRTDHLDTGVDQVALKAAQIHLLYSKPPFMILNLIFAPAGALALRPTFPAWAVVSWVALI